MSYNGPGQYGGYTPPPPSMNGMPRRGLSPWAWVGIGCGGLTVLAFGGCVAAVMVVKNNVQHEMSQPVTEAQISHDLGSVPRYPGAKLDDKTTHAARVAMTFMRSLVGAKGEGGAAGFATQDSFLKVLDWYDKKLTAMEYKPVKQQGNAYTYQKGQEIVMIQALSHESNPSGGTQFMIIRFQDPHPSAKSD